MNNVIVITQNVKLPSLAKLKNKLIPGKVLIVSTQYLFENERELIDGILKTSCEFLTFSDLLSDEERELCDKDAFCPRTQKQDVFAYYHDIKVLKNERIINNLLARSEYENRIIVCDDLGVYKQAWLNRGFVDAKCDYYFNDSSETNNKLTEFLKRIAIIKRIAILFSDISIKLRRSFSIQISVAHRNGVKYLFYGSLNRIGYRIDLDFKKAGGIERLKYIINNLGIVGKNSTIRLSSFHEGYHKINDKKNLNVKLIQDGYLPPNYSSNYLYFYGLNTEFYTWDKIGCNTFIYHHLPHRIMPFRKKLYLPEPVFPQKIKKVLCVASGAGDWTAVKNRSDEDRMIWAFGQVAKKFPNIEFIYRCHPVWIHPLHQGVNSINRAAEYISWLNLPNYKLSGHIPNAVQNGKFCLSYKRSSFEEDLEGVDIVFGEHSIAMIDAAFKGVLFCSCNVTGHRNFFEDITNLGFPHCESVDALISLIKKVEMPEFKDAYLKAVKNYNEMTDMEE